VTPSQKNAAGALYKTLCQNLQLKGHSGTD